MEATIWQKLKDHMSAPLRLTILSDEMCIKWGLTSINEERLQCVLPHLSGRLLDMGCGTNRLLALHRERHGCDGIGVDVYDWKSDALIVEDTSRLPFPDNSFDTISCLAALNHIPNREAVLAEAFRLTKPGGKLVMTMINPVLSYIGHRFLWWYGEDKERGMADGEVYGFWTSQMRDMSEKAGFVFEKHQRFTYKLNNLYLFSKPG